ncbi:hypothetical protein [Aeribacillus pallidus]|uniref:hypothetical protein n=1 Tax=Aeribacillus pallidus TaxID=33936 RepID=UPI003D23C9F9
MLDNVPINGFSGTFGTIIAVIIGMICFFVAKGYENLILIIPILTVIYRLYSYVVYERHLEK